MEEESGEEERRFLTAEFVAKILKARNIICRFVFVLESEAKPEIRQIPRFTVGGPRANKNPLDTPLDDLYEVSRLDYSRIEIPPGWSKVHHFIYLLGDDRDDHGWEYRRDWSDGSVPEGQELWTNDATDRHVRRRMWMTSVVSVA